MNVITAIKKLYIFSKFIQKEDECLQEMIHLFVVISFMVDTQKTPRTVGRASNNSFRDLQYKLGLPNYGKQTPPSLFLYNKCPIVPS